MTYQTAEITIYQVPFVRAKNPIFERDTLSDFAAFLDQYKTATYTVQFQRLEATMSVILPIPFAGFYANYALIKSTTIAPNKSVINYRFSYIVDRHAVASNSVKIDLELDYLNTYFFLDKLTSRTYVVREHRNRFKPLAVSPSSTNTFTNIVDYVDEGFKPSLYKATKEAFTTLDNSFTGKSFYLMYKARSNISAGSTQPIACYLLSDVLIKAHTGVENSPTTYFVTPDGARYWFFKQDNPSLNISLWTPDSETSVFTGWSTPNAIAVSISHASDGEEGPGLNRLILWRQDPSTGALSSMIMSSTATVSGARYKVNVASGYRALFNESDLTDGGTITQDEINEVPFTYVGIGVGNAQYALNISAIDKSDSRILKIIKLPYPPSAISLNANGDYSFDGFLYSENERMYALVDFSKEFSLDLNPLEVTEGFVTTITQPAVSNLYTTPRSVLDPKIYNSSYFYYKLGYDSFSVVLPLERINITNDIDCENLNVTFKPSNTITSRFLFFFEFDNSGLASFDDFNQYLIVSRNNEMPIYSSSYLDYLRQGYNYDVKNKNIADISRWVGFGLNTLGAGLQLATGSQFGVASAITSLSGGLANAITGQIQSDTKMEETLHNKSLQSGSVSGADDSDLLSYYGGNELRLYTYKCHDEIATSLDNFFYYYGYATNRYEIPNYNSRLNFNYLECVAEFTPTLTLNVSIIEAIKAKLKEGVTIFHYHDETSSKYDIGQQYENFESFFKE